MGTLPPETGAALFRRSRLRRSDGVGDHPTCFLRARAAAPSLRQLNNRHMPVLRRPGARDDPLLVELADDRAVFESRQPQIAVPDGGDAVWNVGGLLAV